MAVSGPADPPGAKPPPSDDPKPPEKKTAAKAKAEKGKPDKEKATEPVAEAKPPEDETSGLARQRALALVEYLLQAGMRPGQIAAGPDKGAGPATVALAP